ncbi:MAG: hypothetical protein ACOC5K_00285, partial [Chloroflexota bacterium]
QEPTATPAATVAPTPSPTPSPTASPSPTPQPTDTSAPTATPTAAPTQEELRERLIEIGRRVAEVRGLPPVEDPNVRLVSQEEVSAVIQEELASEDMAARLGVGQTVLKLLGLIPEDADLVQMQERLLSGTVVGLYDPDSGELMVLAEDAAGESGGLTARAEFVYAHEYIHLLQDEHLGLDEKQEALEDAGNDEQAAFTALVEGDASLGQGIYGFQEMDLGSLSPAELEELVQPTTEQREVLETTPEFLIQSQQFPYTNGATFASQLWQEGGMEAINDAWEDPPATTEQVLHIDKYRAQEEPQDVSLPPIAPVLGDGWSVGEEEVLGEFFLRAWLQSIGASPPEADRAAAGWGGDALRLLEGPNGAVAMAVLLAWDDPGTDAGEFTDLLSGLLEDSADFEGAGSVDGAGMNWRGPAGYLALRSADSGEVAIAVAPDAEGASDIAAAILED